MKTYGVAITAGGTTYYFHCQTTAQVRNLVNESSEVTALVVTEETSDYTNKTYRTMSDREILHEIFLADTARDLVVAP